MKLLNEKNGRECKAINMKDMLENYNEDNKVYFEPSKRNSYLPINFPSEYLKRKIKSHNKLG